MRGHEHIDGDAAGTKQDTALWLTTAARENGLPARSVKTSDSGFWITPALGDILRNPPEPEPEVEETLTGVVTPVEDEPVKKTRRNTKKKASGEDAEKNETEE